MSFLWDIGKQNSPRCDAAAERGVRTGGYSVFLEDFYQKFVWKLKITPVAPRNISGLIQMIMVGKSIRQKWVK